MNNKRWDALYLNAKIVLCTNANSITQPIDGGIAVQEGKIAWIGKISDLKESPEKLAREVHDVSGKCITPGFIDCHTHLVYAGNRAHEFEQRLKGASYEQIAASGGGIVSTVRATREASSDELFNQSIPRARAFLAGGVTTLEIKSGYGLDLPTELKILRVAKQIGEELPLTIVTTFLGAHAVPKEFANQSDQYIHFVCEEMIPQVAEEKLAFCVDVFSEKIAFNLEQTERVFSAAKKYGLKIKCHAEQLSNSGSAALAARFDALSVDHLEFLSEEGVKAIAKSNSVAVLLPGAFYFLKETQKPPVHLLRQYKVPMAISTDCNPGTSPVTSLVLMLNMACVLFNLTPEEAILGATKFSAQALGLDSLYGTLEVGKMADFVIWNVSTPSELAYYFGNNPCQSVVKHGVVI